MKALDIIGEIRRAKADPKLSALAAGWAADAIKASLQKDHSRTPGMLRASDSGNCVRQVFADAHDLFDIEEDVTAQLCSMDPGTLTGAHLAALLKVGIEQNTAKYGMVVELEAPVTRGEMTGSADALISQVGGDPHDYDLTPLAVVEFKRSSAMGEPRPPEQPNKSKGKFGNYETREHHVLQAVKYAKRLGAPLAIVVTSNGFGIRADEYLVADWEAKIAADDARLAAALGDKEPEGDPQQGYRCDGCRYSGCGSNANPLREVA